MNEEMNEWVKRWVEAWRMKENADMNDSNTLLVFYMNEDR